MLATNGDTHLGGEDFDQRVMQYIVKLHQKKTGVDIKADGRAMQKLRREVRVFLCNIVVIPRTASHIQNTCHYLEIISSALNLERFTLYLPTRTGDLFSSCETSYQVQENIEFIDSTLEPRTSGHICSIWS